MSAESLTHLYKGTVTPKAGNETILGTPVPVAHSTVGCNRLSNSRKHSRIHQSELQTASPGFEKQTYVLQPFSTSQQHNVSNSNNEELSILNIDTLKGLSDSVLDRSLQVPKYSKVPEKLNVQNQTNQTHEFRTERHESLAKLLTDTEAEPQKIRFDEEELKTLEEAFNDFDCEPSEATAPTRVCETFAHQVSCKALETGEECSDGNTTSIPSLSTTEDVYDVDGSTVSVVDMANPGLSTPLHGIPQAAELSTPVSELHLTNMVKSQSDSSNNGCGQLDLKLHTRQYSHLPCLTGLSSVFEIDSNETKSYDCIQSNVCPTAVSPLKPDNIVTVSSVHTLINHTSNSTNNHLLQPMNGNSPLLTQTQLQQPDSSCRRSHVTKTVNNLTNATNVNLKNRTSNQSDVSQIDISCLHLSDIDGLLDLITAVDKNPEISEVESVSRQNKLTSHLGKQLAAVRQALKPNVPGPSEKQSNVPQSKMDELKENLPPVDKTSSGKDVTFRKTYSHHLNLVDAQVSSNSSPKPYLTRAITDNSSSHRDGFAISQKDSSFPKVHKSQNVPILSNTNCLIWAGAICRQIHQQHFLIKHQIDKPVTISFVIHPKSEVFKLVDENGYLITGILRIHLPPNLEYEVNVAYVAKHPVSWDFGHLLLRSEDSKTSTFKVRLIGYTNSSQLVYSCCSKLSSNVYWTIASKVDPISESIMNKNNDKSHQGCVQVSTKCGLTSNLSGCCLASLNISNFGSRSAWVFTRVEWLDQKLDNQNVVNSEGVSNRGVTVEPKALVIGSKQSQNIFITLRPGVEAARIVFYHGDEVVRYQFRQLCDYSKEITSKLGKRSNHSRRDNRLRLSDILEDFKHEQSIQVVELPPASFSDLRPQDWHQAFINQVSHCERMFLYIYASKHDETSDNVDQLCVCSPSSISESVYENSLASVFVQQDAFKRRNSLNSIHNEASTFVPKPVSRKTSLPQAHASKTLNPASSLSPSSKEMSPVQPPKIKLSPPYTLVFPPCAIGCSTEAQFSVSLKHHNSLPNSCYDPSSPYSSSFWRVFWSANPVTDVQVRSITSSSTYSIHKQSITMEQTVFRLLLPSESKSPSQIHMNKSISAVGILSSDVNNTEFHSLLLPFRFKPTSYCDDVLVQDWHLNFWLEPCIKTESHVIPKFNAKDSVTLLVTLEGSCCKQTLIEGSSHIQSFNDSNLKYSPQKPESLKIDRTLLMPVENTPKTVHIGPLDVVGLPVSFDAIDSNSSVTSRSHNIVLINRMKKTEALVKLKLPSPPFYILEPKQSRFRISPRSRVQIVLSFRPYTRGKSSSVLGICVEYLKQENAFSENNCHAKPTIDPFQIHLFGTLY
ncbi:hypothetical protein MN116_003409 [Schistosoma mekongi]|uniref:Uncharacterized protein n=1 Tax=Schistosoma mekongi TaxID=38744 RepID=A0AAE2D7M1_SCHME|nr:hypothetical protein MN116_003409 [Schistosoma mekongi]